MWKGEYIIKFLIYSLYMFDQICIHHIIGTCAALCALSISIISFSEGNYLSKVSAILLLNFTITTMPAVNKTTSKIYFGLAFLRSFWMYSTPGMVSLKLFLGAFPWVSAFNSCLLDSIEYNINIYYKSMANKIVIIIYYP